MKTRLVYQVHLFFGALFGQHGGCPSRRVCLEKLLRPLVLSGRIKRVVAYGVMTCGWSASALAEEWVLDADLIRASGAQWIEQYAPDTVTDHFDLPDPADWQAFWRHIDAALQSYELADLAWIKPEASAALTLLQTLPAAEPFASWLLQRMDYLDMAQQALSAYAPPRETARPPVAPRGPILPPARPARASVSPAIHRAAQQQTRTRENWETKLAGRAAPKRAELLAPPLKNIFQEEGLPPELIWLAEVESSFNPSARSPVGATGLFQFMPATAERFGMTLSPVDQRLDPERSARAAAQYLRFLYGRFGSWPLALAAYNAGEGRVGRLLRAHEGTTFDSIAEHLPSETQMYVPKVLATVALREGINPDHLPAPRKT